MKWKTLLMAVSVAVGLLAAVPAKAVSLNGNDACVEVLLAKFNIVNGEFVFEKGLWSDEAAWTFNYGDSESPDSLKFGTYEYTGDDLGYHLTRIDVKAALAGKSFLPEGEWNTGGLFTPGGPQADISNISFYGCKSVPEPASVLAGLMALGLGVAGRKYLA